MRSSLLLQVTAPALLTGLLLIGTGLGSAWSIFRLRTNLNSILSEHVASVQASLALENNIRQLRFHSFLYVMAPSRDVLAQIDQDEHAFRDAFTRAEEAATSPGEEEYLRRISESYRQYKGEMARIRTEVDRSGPRTDFATLARTHPIRQVVGHCKELGQYHREQLEEAVQASEELSRRARSVLIFLGLAGPVGGLIGGYGIARGLGRSLARLQVRIRDVVDRLDAGAEAGDIQLTLSPDDDLHDLDQQLRHVRTRIEEMMAQLRRQASEMVRSEQMAGVGRLAAGVAHEVRNPLTGMKLLVEAALRPQRPRTLSGEDLRVIHGEITRLEGIVQHFLDFARPQPLQRAPADLREVLASPVELVRARARQQQVEVIVEQPAEPVPVLLDAGQFGTVVLNLLLNALDAMPRGGRLVVRLERDGPGQRGTLTMRDNGPGIPAEVQEKLFTPFVSTKATGTGLGLSLSRRIVEEHGGKIAAANEAGGGACFRVELPLAK